LGTPVDSLDLYSCAGLFFGVKDGLPRPAASAGFKDCRRSRFAGLGTPLRFLSEISQVLLVSFGLPIRDTPLFERYNTGELALSEVEGNDVRTPLLLVF